MFYPLHFFIIILSFQSIISLVDSDFTPIESFSITQIKLSPSAPEVYIKYTNSFASAIIISLKIANSYSTKMFFYKSISDITVTEGSYQNYLFELSTVQKDYIILPTETDKFIQGTYYIIIKDTNNYSYQDYLSIHNQSDEMPWQSHTAITVTQFLGTKELKFKTVGNGNKIINIQYKQSTASPSISVKIEKISGPKEKVYEDNKSTVNEMFNKDKSYNGDYLITLTLLEDPTDTNTLSLVYFSLDSVVTRLETSIINQYEVIQPSLYYCYYDISEYKIHEENSLTFHVDYFLSSNKILNDVKMKIVNWKDSEVSDDTMITILNSGDVKKEGFFTNNKDSDEIFFLFFRRDLAIEENTKTYLLLLIEIATGTVADYLPQKFSVVPSPRVIYETIGDLGSYSNKITIDSYIPKYYRFSLPKASFTSFIFFASKFKIQTIFVGKIINDSNQTLNTDQLQKQLYAIPKSSQTYSDIITIQFFGPAQTFTLSVMSVISNIIYFEKERPISLLPIEIVEFMSPFYLLGEYEEVKESSLSVDILYGKCDTYYKSDFNANDKSIWPSDQDKFHYLTNMETKFDLISLTCISPARLHLNFVDNNQKYSMKLYASKIVLWNANTVTLEIQTEEQKDKIFIRFEIALDVEVNITIGNEHKILNKDIKELSIEYKVDPGATSVHVYLQSEGATSVSVMTGDKNNFVILTTDKFTAAERNIAVLIGKNNFENIAYIDLQISGLTSAIYYYIAKNDLDYHSLPELSGIASVDQDSEGKWKLKIENPYNKYMNYKEDIAFYLLLTFTQFTADKYYSPNSEVNVSLFYINKEASLPLSPSTDAFLFESINHTIESTRTPNMENKLLNILVTKCDKKNHKNYSLNLQYNSESIRALPIYAEKYSVFTEANHWIKLDINLMPSTSWISEQPTPELMISYVYSSTNYTEQFVEWNQLKDIDLQITYDEKRNEISWNKNDMLDSYDIYILPNYVNAIFDDECLLSTTFTKNKTIDDHIYSLGDIEAGRYVVLVVGHSKSKDWPFRIMYDEKIFRLRK